MTLTGFDGKGVSVSGSGGPWGKNFAAFISFNAASAWNDLLCVTPNASLGVGVLPVDVEITFGESTGNAQGNSDRKRH